MSIGVIGAGSMGRILARHLIQRGHHVSIANSRGPESLTALAAEIGATPVSIVDAAKAGEIVILAIPTKAVAGLPRALFAKVPSSVVVIDIGNYHPELRDGRIDAIDRGMLDSQWVAQQIGRPVIKAFNNILAKSLLEKGVPRGAVRRIALSAFGDSPDAKTLVLHLVDELGFDPVDGGDLANSWRQQPGTPAYCRDLEAAALRRALAEADRSRIAEYRAEQEARIQVYRGQLRRCVVKRLWSVPACALAILLSSQSLSEAQGRSDQKSKVVAVNTNELEEFPVESGEMKFIALSEDTNGAFAVVERTQQPCYKTTWHRHDNFEESFYVLEGVWTVQIADKVHEFPAGSYVLIPRGTPHGQGNFTHKPVRLLVMVAPGGFERFYKDRVELFKTKGSNKAELEKGLEALRRKYVQIIDYTWDITKECRE